MFTNRWIRMAIIGVLLPLGLMMAIGASEASGDGPTLYGDHLRPLITGNDGKTLLNVYGPGGTIVGTPEAQSHSGAPPGLVSVDDHLGSTRLLRGGTAVSHEYGPHGRTPDGAGRYAGHPYDTALASYQTPARDYDPTLGRFLSTDPQREGSSPYPYAGNNPINFVDPTGGGTLPFIIKSGIPYATASDDHVIVSLSRALGLLKNRHLRDAAAVFGQPNQHEDKLYSNARRRPARVLGISEGSTESEYGDRLYWLISDWESIRVPGDLSGGLGKLRTYHPDFARRIVLIDLSQNRMAHASISEALRGVSTGGRHSVVYAKLYQASVRYDDTHYHNITGGLMVNGRQWVGINEVGSHFQTVALQADNPPLPRPRPPRPIVFHTHEFPPTTMTTATTTTATTTTATTTTATTTTATATTTATTTTQSIDPSTLREWAVDDEDRWSVNSEELSGVFDNVEWPD